ncbi:MAG: hypothetical protein AAF741_18955 [Bacteroidota bacterium]
MLIQIGLAVAQPCIRGQVLDKVTNEPISDVLALALDNNIGFKLDSTGRFELCFEENQTEYVLDFMSSDYDHLQIVLQPDEIETEIKVYL